MIKALENNVIKTWGDKGRDWLKSLPSTVEALANYWNLTELVPVRNLSYNYVMTGYQDQLPVVMKIACDLKEITYEQLAIATYNGNGCIKLLDSNFEYNGLLLEQAIPGIPLATLFPDHDDEALRLAVSIMQRLHGIPLPNNASLPTLQEWFKDLFNPPEALPTYHIHRAQKIAHQLFAMQSKVVLLHGDLHHGNILLSDHQWLAIDPKGILGDPAFEICSFMKNPNPDVLKNKKLLLHRLSLFSKYLSIDQDQLYAWLYAQTVLDACWAMKEGQTDRTIAFAHVELVDAISSKFL